jgi:RNA polymerase sigma factor for flagellar operon FliA
MSKRALKLIVTDNSIGAEKPEERRSGSRKAPGFASRRGKKLSMGLTRSELVLKFQSKVRIMALKIAKGLGTEHDIDDLCSMGFIGLMDAAEKFDPSRNVQFNTYAEFRIRGAIIDGLRQQDWVPRSARDRMKTLREAAETIEARSGKAPSELEMSQEMKMSLAKFREMMGNLGCQTLVNIDELPETARESVNDMGASDPFKETVRNEAKAIVDRLIDQLPERQRLVLRCLYYRGLTATEVAEILDISTARVSQIHFQAIAMMRDAAKPQGVQTENLLVALIDE